MEKEKAVKEIAEIYASIELQGKLMNEVLYDLFDDKENPLSLESITTLSDKLIKMLKDLGVPEKIAKLPFRHSPRRWGKRLFIEWRDKCVESLSFSEQEISDYLKKHDRDYFDDRYETEGM